MHMELRRGIAFLSIFEATARLAFRDYLLGVLREFRGLTFNRKS